MGKIFGALALIATFAIVVTIPAAFTQETTGPRYEASIVRLTNWETGDEIGVNMAHVTWFEPTEDGHPERGTRIYFLTHYSPPISIRVREPIADIFAQLQ